MALLGSLLSPLMADVLVAGSVIALSGAGFALTRMRARLRAQSLSAALTKSAIEHLSEGFYRIDRDGRIVFANQAFIRMQGYRDWDDFRSVMDGPAADIYVEPGRRAEFLSLLDRDGVVHGFVSEVRRHKTGEHIWVNENARQVRDSETGLVTHYEGTVREATGVVERVRSEARLQKLTQHVPGGLFQLERRAAGEFSVVYASQGFCDMLDRRFSPASFDISHFISLIHPEDLDQYYESLKLSRKTGADWMHEFRVVTDAGKTKWFKVDASPEMTSAGSVIWHGYLQDVTAMKADQAEVRQLAYNDPLTKLPNRRFLADRLSEAVAACGRRHEQSALLFIDLDHFKQLNDMHGHEAGDRLLVEVAGRMRRAVRRNDTVVRLSGDEFVILADGLSGNQALSEKKAEQIANKTLAALRRPFNLGAVGDYAISASIGVIIFDESARSVEDILRRADLAMYEVKRGGRNSFRIFRPEREEGKAHNAEISDSLAGAVQRGEFELRLQPQVNDSGRVIGAEALLRWNHPAFGQLTPDSFMPIAEQSGHASEINRHVVEEAVKVLQCWAQSDRGNAVQLSVNLGAEQFLRPDFARELRNLLRASGIRTGALVLEISEDMIGKLRGDAIKHLSQLKTTGVKLALDDFGAGQMSLSSLKDMPIDEVKVDGSFIKAMSGKPKDLAVVKSILGIAQALGMAATAKHVETAAQEKILLESGCARFQGFLYGGALSRTDFELMSGLAASPDEAKVA